MTNLKKKITGTNLVISILIGVALIAFSTFYVKRIVPYHYATLMAQNNSQLAKPSKLHQVLHGNPVAALAFDMFQKSLSSFLNMFPKLKEVGSSAKQVSSQLEAAKKLKDKNISYELINKATGLSISVIEKL